VCATTGCLCVGCESAPIVPRTQRHDNAQCAALSAPCAPAHREEGVEFHFDMCLVCRCVGGCGGWGVGVSILGVSILGVWVRRWQRFSRWKGAPTVPLCPLKNKARV